MRKEISNSIKNIIKAAAFTLAFAVGIAGTGMSKEVFAKDADGDVVIVIDPGHGGSDPGKIGHVGGVEVHEDEANYKIALAMKNRLEQYDGVKVYFTRPYDSWFTNTGRAMVAKELNADFLVCLHNNSGGENNTGAIVFTSLLPLYSGITADMGNNILDGLSQVGLVNNGIQTRSSTEYAGEDFYTIMAESMRAGTPAVLVEHCFMSSAQDIMFLVDSDGKVSDEKVAKLGYADADAVVKYFGLLRRTATADSVTTVSLEKGYSVDVTAGQLASGTVSWLSSDESIVTVDEYGMATAVNSGTAKVMYSYADGTNGYLTIEVKVPSQVALVGSLDPTFYNKEEDFKNIALSNITANVIYTDGSVKKVNVESVGSVDFTKEGFQDISISYGALSGSVRICYSPEGFQPEEVTSRAEVEATSEAVIETETESEISLQPTTAEVKPEKPTGFDYMMIVKLVAAFIVVVIFGTLIYIIENSVSKKRKNNRRGRRY